MKNEARFQCVSETNFHKNVHPKSCTLFFRKHSRRSMSKSCRISPTLSHDSQQNYFFITKTTVALSVPEKDIPRLRLKYMQLREACGGNNFQERWVYAVPTHNDVHTPAHTHRASARHTAWFWILFAERLMKILFPEHAEWKCFRIQTEVFPLEFRLVLLYYSSCWPCWRAPVCFTVGFFVFFVPKSTLP